MCLGVPGKIVEVFTQGNAPMAHVDFDGEVRRICLAYLPDLAVGDFIVAHMGFALTKIDEQTADSTLELMREYGVLDTPAHPASPTLTAPMAGQS